MAEEVGAAFVSLFPVAKGFSKLVRAQLKKELKDPIEVPVTPEWDRRSFPSEIPPPRGKSAPKMPVEVDPIMRVFEQQVKRDIAGLAREALAIPVNADTSDMHDEVRKELAGIERDLRLVVQAEPGDRDELRRKLQADIDRVRERITVDVDVDVDVDKDKLSTSLRSAGKEAEKGGDFLSKLFTSGFGSSLLNPLIGIPALVLAAVASVPLAGLVAAGGLLGGVFGVAFAGAFLLKADPEMQAAGQRLVDRLTVLFTNAAQPLKAPFIRALDAIGDSFERMKPHIDSIFESVASMIDVLVGQGGEQKSGIIGFLESVIPNIAETLPKAMPVIEQLAMALPDIGDALGQLFTSMGIAAPAAADILGTTLRTVADVIRFVGDAIVWLTARWESVKNAIKFVGDAAQILWQRLVNIWNAIKGDTEGLQNDLKIIFASIKEKWDNLWDSMVGPAKNAITGAVNAVRALPSQVGNIFSGAGTWLVNAGRAIVNGLIQGIKDRFGAAADIARNLAGAIRNFLPFSPAKEGPFSGHGAPLYSGRAIAEDLAAGIEDGIPKAGAAGAALVGAVGPLALGSGLQGGTAAPVRGELAWSERATGDAILDAFRDFIVLRYGGDAQFAFGGAPA